MELCKSEMVVITLMTEKIPTVIPEIVNDDRNLLAPSELHAIWTISRVSIGLGVRSCTRRRPRPRLSVAWGDNPQDRTTDRTYMTYTTYMYARWLHIAWRSAGNRGAAQLPTANR